MSLEVLHVKNVLKDKAGTPIPYACSHNAQALEFQPGEVKALPKVVAEFVVAKSYLAGRRVSALQFIKAELKVDGEGESEQRSKRK